MSIIFPVGITIDIPPVSFSFMPIITMERLMGFNEGYLEYPDGLKIRYRINEHNKGAVAVFIHGVGERLETYDYMFPYFETAGIGLNALELRGHGKSGGALSSFYDFSFFAKDFKRFIFGNLQNRPVFLVSTGAGSLLAVCIAADPRFLIRGTVFVSPLFFASVPPSKMLSIQLLARILPGMFVPSPWTSGPAAFCCGDEAQGLQRGRFPAGFFRALFSEMKRARSDLLLLRSFPSLLVYSEEDLISDIAQTQQLFKSAFADSQNLKVVSCKKCTHQILVDKDRLDFVEKIIRWISKIETGGKAE